MISDKKHGYRAWLCAILTVLMLLTFIPVHTAQAADDIVEIKQNDYILNLSTSINGPTTIMVNVSGTCTISGNAGEHKVTIIVESGNLSLENVNYTAPEDKVALTIRATSELKLLGTNSITGSTGNDVITIESGATLSIIDNTGGLSLTANGTGASALQLLAVITLVRLR